MTTPAASPTELKIPGLGESITEATLTSWTVPDGAQVSASDAVAELETDKATVELPAGKSGTIKILVPKGSTVTIGQTVAQILPAGAGAPAAAQPTKPAEPAQPKVEAAPQSPAVERLLAEHHLDPAQIPTSGKDGRLTKGDVLDYLAKTQPAAAPTASEAPTDAAAASASQKGRGQSADDERALAASGTTTVYAPPAPSTAPLPPQPPVPPVRAAGPEENRVEMSRLRQTIARRLVEAQHATASLTTFNEIDMTAVMALRARYKESFEKAHGVGLGFMSFFAKAVCHGVKAVPAVNASIDGTAIVYHNHVHLGIAVSTDKGLMVPVVRYADQLSMAQIEAEIKRLATKAREGKITLDDLGGGTFTITNGGIFGSLLSTPILNPPQSGILGMHKIEKRPMVETVGGQDTVVIRPMMYVALTYDHRVIDGQQSVTFLVKVKEALEDPTRMLMEI